MKTGALAKNRQDPYENATGQSVKAGRRVLQLAHAEELDR